MIGRDGGYTTKIGGEILWGFGDTLFYGPAADGSTYRTNSGAHNVPGYYRLDEPLDSSGATAAPLVPLSRSEVAHNQASSTKYHTWPSGSITQATGNATVFFSVTEIDRFEIMDRGVGTATVVPGATRATRASTLLFTQSECPWHSAHEANGYVYLFSFLGRPARAGCPHRDGFLPTGIARAPKAEMTDRSAYRFWNGTSWTTDQTQTTTILAGVPGHLSMAWNEHLGKFLTIYGFGQEESFYTTADRPEGPWAPLQKFHTGLTGKNYFWLQHPTLASSNHDVILVSYLHPTGVLTSENRLIAVAIDPAAAGRVDDHVHRTYQTLLGRRADGDGLAYWTNALSARRTSAGAFARAVQFSDAGYDAQVRERYLTVLDRPADRGGLDYWSSWLSTHKRHDILTARLAGLGEFKSTHPTNAGYVNALYRIALGRPGRRERPHLLGAQARRWDEPLQRRAVDAAPVRSGPLPGPSGLPGRSGTSSHHPRGQLRRRRLRGARVRPGGDTGAGARHRRRPRGEPGRMRRPMPREP